MSLQGKKVLVTGGTGFIGGRVVEKLCLEQGASVRVLVRNFSKASRIARFPIEMIKGDITDVEAVDKAIDGCDVIFHCAYDFGIPPQKGRVVDNSGTKNIAEAALKHKVERIVHVGTFSVYGTPDGEIDETSVRTTSPIDQYQNTKLLSENLMLDYHKKHGLPVTVVQPTIVYGPFSRPWTISVADQLMKGPFPLPGDGGGYCNPVYIDDVVEGMFLAAEKDEALGEMFLLSSEETVTWREFYGAFEKKLGVDSVVCVPAKELERPVPPPNSAGKSAAPAQPAKPTVSQRWKKHLKDPEFRLTLIDTPIINLPYLIAKRSPLSNTFIGQMWEGRITEKVQPKPNAAPKPAAKAAPPKYAKLHPVRFALFQSKSEVKIDKAKNVLGYQPAYNFENGMAATAEFLEWYFSLR